LVIALSQKPVQHVIRNVTRIDFYNASYVSAHFLNLHYYSLWNVQKLSPSAGRALQGLPDFVIDKQLATSG
jgi:hypothetical protein